MDFIKKGISQCVYIVTLPIKEGFSSLLFHDMTSNRY